MSRLLPAGPIAVLVLAALLALSVAGCGKRGPPQPPAASAEPGSNQPVAGDKRQ